MPVVCRSMINRDECSSSGANKMIPSTTKIPSDVHTHLQAIRTEAQDLGLSWGVIVATFTKVAQLSQGG